MAEDSPPMAVQCITAFLCSFGVLAGVTLLWQVLKHSTDSLLLGCDEGLEALH